MQANNILFLEEILFNIEFGIAPVEDQILASLLADFLNQRWLSGFETIDELLAVVLEYLTDNGLTSSDLDEEVNRLMKVLNNSPLKENLDLLQQFSKDTKVIALLNIDNDWHPAHIVSYDLTKKTATVRFIEWPSILAELTKDKFHLEPDCNNSITPGTCYFCKRQMKMSRHHLYPKEMHLKYIKKGFTKEFLASNTLSLCRPCHSAVHRAEPNDVLASDYNTPESLIKHPKIIKFVNYIKNRTA